MATLGERIGNAVKAFRGEDSGRIDWETIKREAPPLEHKGFGFSTTLEGIADEWYLRSGYDRIYSLLAGSGPGWAGEPVTQDTAQNVSAVIACRRILSETFSSLPVRLVQKDEDSPKPRLRVVKSSEMPVVSTLRTGNDLRSAFGMKESALIHLLFSGNCFFKITRRSGGSGVPVDINLLIPEQVEVKREERGAQRVMYTIHQRGKSDQNYFLTPGQPQDIFHVRGAGYDGLMGYNVLHLARQTLGTTIAGEKNWARFLARGGRTPYLLKRRIPFKDDNEYIKFRRKWETAYNDPHKPPILEGDAEYQDLGKSMRDIQMLEARGSPDRGHLR